MPEQWLQRHPEAGLSWPSWPKISQLAQLAGTGREHPLREPVAEHRQPHGALSLDRLLPILINFILIQIGNIDLIQIEKSSIQVEIESGIYPCPAHCLSQDED